MHFSLRIKASAAALCVIALLSSPAYADKQLACAFCAPPGMPHNGAMQAGPAENMSLRNVQPNKADSATKHATRMNLFGLFGGDKKPEEQGSLGMGTGCDNCKMAGVIDCPTCKGTGKCKETGNAMERWKCVKCQGFGFVPCPNCGKGKGLTPEQTGER